MSPLDLLKQVLKFPAVPTAQSVKKFKNLFEKIFYSNFIKMKSSIFQPKIDELQICLAKTYSNPKKLYTNGFFFSRTIIYRKDIF